MKFSPPSSQPENTHKAAGAPWDPKLRQFLGMQFLHFVLVFYKRLKSIYFLQKWQLQACILGNI